MHRKKGEEEAVKILKSKGYDFDESYSDDNAKASMPDLRYKDGRFLEVTHTFHNNNLSTISRFQKKSISQQLCKQLEVKEALKRIKENDARKKDFDLIDEFFGEYDFERNRRSEFNVDNPIIEESYDNILYEIIKDKGPKYKDGDVDLFVFITGGEFESLSSLFKTKEWNACYTDFMNSMLNKSPFTHVFLCVWDLIKNEYNLTDPTLILFYKTSGSSIEYKRL